MADIFSIVIRKVLDRAIEPLYKYRIITILEESMRVRHVVAIIPACLILSTSLSARQTGQTSSV